MRGSSGPGFTIAWPFLFGCPDKENYSKKWGPPSGIDGGPLCASHQLLGGFGWGTSRWQFQ